MGKHQNSIRNFMDMCETSIPLKVEGKEEGKEEEKKKKGPMKKKQKR